MRPLQLIALLALSSPALQAQTLDTDLYITGLSSPVYMTAPEGDARLFIVQQDGQILIHKDGAVLPTPFLDIDPLTNGGGESGLLGLAFHPDYANNGRFFINYTNTSGNTRVVEYGVSADPDIADPTQVQTILGVNQPFSNHNGGCIKFGADGMLYVGMGDGGSANDPGNRAQNPTNNLGKMLRFDIDLPAPYIPADNPFVGVAGTNDEIWALGVRNPWRFSFDRLTGDMWIGDVGQGAKEEIDFQPASSTGGENYGWRCMEGFNCTGLSGCTCNSAPLTLPVHDYTHAGGNCSVTGGYVYRGSNIPSLQGTYFYADFCTARVWSFELVGGSVTNLIERTGELDPPGNPFFSSVSSFAEDGFGEMYIIDISGKILKIVLDCPTSNYCTTSPNSVGSGSTISANGSRSISTNDFRLRANSAPAGQSGVFYYGPNQISMPFGDGVRCVGGTAFRLNPPVAVGTNGSVVRALDFTAPPASSGPGMILPGASWNFQFWYRDPTFGSAGFNLSDAVNVVFCP